MTRLIQLLGGWSIQWILVFTLVGYPIVAACSSILGIENRPISIAVRAVILVLVAFAVIVWLPRGIKRENLFFWAAWWVFWFAYILRLLVDSMLNPAALRLPLSEYFVFTVGVCLLPSTAAALGDTRINAKLILNKLIWAGALGMTLNLLFIFFSGGGIGIDTAETLRVESEVLNPIAIGHLGVSIFLLVFWRFSNSGSIHFGTGSLLLISLLIAVAGIISSASRGPLLALVIALGVYAMVLPRYFFSKAILALIFAGALLVIYFFAQGYEIFFFTRIFEGIFEDSARFDLLSGAARLILENPLIGAGIEPMESYPHNLIVESFLAYGLVTGLPFLFMVIFSVSRVSAVARLNREYFWVCLLFVQYLIGGMVSGSLYSSWAFFTMMVLVVSIPLHTVSHN